MSERTDLIEQIEELRGKKEGAAHRAALLEHRCAGLRADNPEDCRIRDLDLQIEALDEFCDNADGEIAKLNRQLWDIEQGMALRDVLAARAYYYWSAA